MWKCVECYQDDKVFINKTIKREMEQTENSRPHTDQQCDCKISLERSVSGPLELASQDERRSEGDHDGKCHFKISARKPSVCDMHATGHNHVAVWLRKASGVTSL